MDLPYAGSWPTDETGPTRGINPLRARLLSREQLLAKPRPEALIHGVLMLNSTAWIVGRPGSGKSFLALDMAGAVATGQPWQGRLVRPGRVLYVAAEAGASIGQRVRAWEAANKVSTHNVTWLDFPINAAGGDWGNLVEIVGEDRPALVVLDTQARMTRGMEENSSKDMGEYVAAVDRLREACGGCVVSVHHSSKAGQAIRGSTALEGAADTVIQLERADDGVITVSNPKQKDSEQFPECTFRLASNGNSAVLIEC